MGAGAGIRTRDPPGVGEGDWGCGVRRGCANWGGVEVQKGEAGGRWGWGQWVGTAGALGSQGEGGPHVPLTPPILPPSRRCPRH